LRAIFYDCELDKEFKDYQESFMHL